MEGRFAIVLVFLVVGPMPDCMANQRIYPLHDTKKTSKSGSGALQSVLLIEHLSCYTKKCIGEGEGNSEGYVLILVK